MMAVAGQASCGRGVKRGKEKRGRREARLFACLCQGCIPSPYRPKKYLVGIHQFTNFQYRDRKKVTIRLTESTQKVDE
eukprot:scaffold1891_cov139-Skeletonema_menzelii.AAC.8